MILVDTDVLICHLRGLDAARDWLRRTREKQPLAVSVVTLTELASGMRSAERYDVNRLLSAFRTEPVTESIAREAGRLMREYRRSHSGIGLGDYLIAATALHRGIPLATLNVRHFPMLDDLEAPFVP
ncbi:MAG TPA: type II toxin-antitoxin system VapC family toxin [Arachnia sp.]|nr:type II toxin-antitoxin system VapC family toxin [Arachnia sp.]HMT85000.1 type II toxin-antitoxin system VapC family toxin [Arachnia sp.]